MSGAFSIFRWFRDISIARKLYFTVGIMATLIALELAVLVFSVNTLSSVRAYVGGEGLWSKAQKDAMYQLLKYSRTHDEEDYYKFLELMRVPLGDHKTLTELRKEEPDMEIARRGLIEGRNHTQEVEGMISLFRRFHSVSYINKAINIWVEADSLVAGFVPIGKKLHRQVNSDSASVDLVNDILKEIDPINARLTELEDEFSYTLGEGSRWLENLVLKLLFAIALTVELTGLILAIAVSRGLQKGLNEILISAQAVARGDFSKRAKAFSQDEIGVLAHNFNYMADELEHSIIKIEHNHQKFKSLLESAPDAVVIVNDDGIIRMVNSQCGLMFGYTKEDLIGRSIELLLPHDHKEKRQWYRNVAQAQGNNKLHGTGIELTGQRRSGEEFPVEISLSPLEEKDETLVFAAIRDISDRRYIKELESKNKELEQFAFVSSHDLREPLNTIISLVSVMQEEYKGKLDDEGLNFLGYIKESSYRMTSLITDLLEYSRLGRKSDLEAIDCNELVYQVIADMRASIEDYNAHIQIDKLPLIKGHPVELRLLFQNLLSNAVKFQEKGVEPVIRVSVEELEKYFHFTVEDNGIGIEKSQQEKIFVMFQRVDTMLAYEGSGIGLAHCKKIVELHGGRIWVDSTPGQGSRFHFTLQKVWQAPKPDGIH